MIHSDKLPNISIGVLVYNHAKYIKRCLDSLIAQTGNFNLKIIIHDDCSTDNSESVIRDFIQVHPDSDKLQIIYNRHLKNLGCAGVKNLESLVKSMHGSDYFALIDGDDYYSSILRIALHLQLHKSDPQISLSFNKLQFYYESSQTYEDFIPKCQKISPSTEDLILENFIGNLGCAFYNSRFLDRLPKELFAVPCYDWFFSTVYSQFGKIIKLDKFLNIYRHHSEGLWSGLRGSEVTNKLLPYIEQYNKFFDYKYDVFYSILRDELLCNYEFELLIVNDFFPHPQSGFLLQEFTSLMEAMPQCRVYCRGKGASFFGANTIEELVRKYKTLNPHLDSQLQVVPFKYGKVKLLYINFISSAYDLIVHENYKIPFVLTVYPGGGFALNSEEVDSRMKMIFGSPFFRKAIVTQDIIYKYLIEKKFCKPEQLELVFGVVTPLNTLEQIPEKKRSYGVDKEVLEICFVAHKYTQFGQDKGYDTFIEAANRLAEKYSNLRFHIVGPWKRETVNVTVPAEKIFFYGSQEQQWFNEFYLDKDILISPNIPNQIYEGSFDGFPTGCASDAALREVAIFCTDPLNLNNGRFIDSEEIVIILPEAEDIVAKVISYYDNPDKLRKLAIKGASKARMLYSYNSQIKPRVKLLKDEIVKSEQYFPATASSKDSVVEIQPTVVSETQEAFPIVSVPQELSISKVLIRKIKTAFQLALARQFHELQQRAINNIQSLLYLSIRLLERLR